MVSITVQKRKLAHLLRRRVDSEELAALLQNAKTSVEAESETEYQLEITGDRPDLLSTEGVARAVNGLLGEAIGLAPLPLSTQRVRVSVDASVLPVRPVIAAAEARGLRVDDDELRELMQVQEKLTLTHGRRRRKVAIGIHDADAVTGPFHYEAVPLHSNAFIPLGHTKEMTPAQILAEHEKGKAYAHLIGERAPLITDSQRRVLSMPPVINGALTQLTQKTRNVFLDVTGTDVEACNTALVILCQNFADLGATIVPAEIRYPDRILVTPDTQPSEMRVSLVEINAALGLKLGGKQAAALLQKQRLEALAEGDYLHVHCPRYRADFLHPVDVVEEAALAYGFEHFDPLPPRSFTHGSVSDYTRLQRRWRDALAGAGFTEVATYVLSNTEKARRANSSPGVPLLNPVSADYNHLRADLLPNLLDVLRGNTHHSYPQRVFEVGEVVRRTDEGELKTETVLRAAALVAHASANASETASLLTAVAKRFHAEFQLENIDDALFTAGRAARVHWNKKAVGVVGEIHPQVLENFKLEVPVAGFELEIGINAFKPKTQKPVFHSKN